VLRTYQMSLYDEQCKNDFRLLIESKLHQSFAEMAVECPYELPHDAIFYQALSSPLSSRVMELFLASGYRRNGNCLYTMHCRHCLACIPIRLHVREMQFNRNQRRVLKKNLDLQVEFASIEPNPENISLCGKFLKHRYGHQKCDGQSYYNSFFMNRIIPGMELRYRLEGQLVGNGIVDIGENWMNAVYFYFDPAFENRSPGTFNILTLIDTCLNLDISYLYLGYYIKNVSAMSYKERFKPYYLYIDNVWQEKK